MSDIDLLPRADIPVLFNDFKTKADAVWSVVYDLVITDVSQKEAMALARKTRLDLRNIRVAVEHKRVELGENHLKEIQKVNSAAKAIREFIEPLEARLLIQEEFGERAEAARIDELALRRQSELYALRPHIIVKDVGSMSQENYDELLGILKAELAEKEAANQLRIEAERKLAEAQAEALAVAEVTRKTLELTQRVALEVKQKEAAARKEIEDRFAAEQQEAKEKYRREQAEKDRIRDEQLAKLEAELKVERAAKFAEEARIRRLALAPDVEKLRDYAATLRGVVIPNVESFPAQRVVREMVCCVSRASALVENFCSDEGLTTE